LLSDPVDGTLVGVDDREVLIRRSDPRAGVVQVHFPRAGYNVAAVRIAGVEGIDADLKTVDVHGDVAAARVHDPMKMLPTKLPVKNLPKQERPRDKNSLLRPQIRKHCEPGDPMCRPRQRQALLHWAYDSRRI
jgi:hypothetical protein